MFLAGQFIVINDPDELSFMDFIGSFSINV